MYVYRPNPACPCLRCRARGLMGPAVLVTIGVLMLLNEVSDLRFDYTWPVLLIVIGLVKVLQSNAPLDGHVERYPYVNPAPPSPPPNPSGPEGGSGQVQNV